MVILVTGDRNWADAEAMGTALGHILRTGDTIVHGAARGADSMAGAVAHNLGLEVFAYPANWTKHGRAAGPIRNRAMLTNHPEIGLVIAFHPDLASSKGTKDMVNVARSRGIPVIVVAGIEDAPKVERP